MPTNGDLFQFTTSTLLADLLRDKDFELRGPAASISPDPLPASLDNFTLEFGVV